MKHVLVLDALADSIGFLNAQRLKGGRALDNMQYDTVALGRHQEALQSVDGIQFYHFTRHKNPALNRGHFTGREHIENYLGELKEDFDKINKARKPDMQEKLNAIVIPGGVLDNIQTSRFLAQLRKMWPDVVVMVTDPKLYAPGKKTPPHYKLVEQIGEIHPMYREPHWLSKNNNRELYVPVGRDTEGFALDPSVTLATPNVGRDMQANILRDALGMERLPRLDPYAGQKAATEAKYGITRGRPTERG